MDHEAEKERWERAIGKFMLKFGDIELFLLKIYQLKMPNRDYFDDDFNNRFDKVIGVFNADGKDKSLIDGLIELKKFTNLRHLIAHNPMYFDLYQHEETLKIIFEISVTNKTGNGERVTIDQLESAYEKISGISSSLYKEL